MVIGQVEEPPGKPHRNRVGRVQAEEPDPGILTAEVHIRSNIRLVEARETRRQAATPPGGRLSW